MSQNFLSTPGVKLTPPGPTAERGQPQADGTVSQMGVPPTKAPLQDRRASPANHNTSGMERAMGAHADKMHPPKRR